MTIIVDAARIPDLAHIPDLVCTLDLVRTLDLTRIRQDLANPITLAADPALPQWHLLPIDLSSANVCQIQMIKPARTFVNRGMRQRRADSMHWLNLHLRKLSSHLRVTLLPSLLVKPVMVKWH